MSSVFVETTIPSFYFETRSDRRSADWRAQTRLWWDRYRARYDLVTSEFVVAEFLRAPDSKSSRAESFFEGVSILREPPTLAAIIETYIQHKAMPIDAAGDAAHLAYASYHAVDFILTWNCRHLANANKRRHIQSLNTRLGLSIPIITTPFELVPE